MDPCNSKATLTIGDMPDGSIGVELVFDPPYHKGGILTPAQALLVECLNYLRQRTAGYQTQLTIGGQNLDGEDIEVTIDRAN